MRVFRSLGHGDRLGLMALLDCCCGRDTRNQTGAGRGWVVPEIECLGWYAEQWAVASWRAESLIKFYLLYKLESFENGLLFVLKRFVEILCKDLDCGVFRFDLTVIQFVIEFREDPGYYA